ncbi:MAG: sugar phosphate isomerase/epimerase [Cyclobacteriaceae bacterium]
MSSKQNRRKFLTNSSAIAGGLLLGSASSLKGAPAILKHFNKPYSVINGVQIGVITYSFRSMEDQSAEATLQYIKDCGISAVELMGGPAESFAGMPQSDFNRRAFYGLMRKQRNGELTADEEKEMKEMRATMDAYGKEVAEWRTSVSMDAFEKFRKMYNDAGVKIYGFKPSAFGKNNTDAEINYGLKAAKALGASHVTLEHPSDDAHTLKLGQMAKQHKIKVAYHGHEQQTPTFWDTALKQSPYNAINPDMGHYIAAGNEQPLELLKKYNDRIASTHLKDRQTPDNGKGNVLWGTGDTPIPAILKLIKQEQYKFPATIELEYKIPDGSDAIKEVQKCLAFCEKSLS